jgi:hypothetical protein
MHLLVRLHQQVLQEQWHSKVSQMQGWHLRQQDLQMCHLQVYHLLPVSQQLSTAWMLTQIRSKKTSWMISWKLWQMGHSLVMALEKGISNLSSSSSRLGLGLLLQHQGQVQQVPQEVLQVLMPMVLVMPHIPALMVEHMSSHLLGPVQHQHQQVNCLPLHLEMFLGLSTCLMMRLRAQLQRSRHNKGAGYLHTLLHTPPPSGSS